MLVTVLSTSDQGEHMNAQEIVQFLDDYLNIHTIEDESNNGLQVESPEEIEKIGFSVDACIDVFRRAHTEGCQLIVVHHGLIWGGIKYMRGDVYKRVKFLMNSNIGLYACHLPLDIHKKVGNNTQMAHLLGLNITGEFGPYKNINLGLLCQADLPLNELTSKIQKTLGDYTLFQFGGDHCKKVGIVTGSGTVALKSAVEQGCDTFITGEPKHASYHTAKENNLNVIFAGHYRTETLGIRALMEKVKEQFAIDTVFIDVPTGL